MKELKVSDIRIDGGTQIRKQLNQDKVNEYAEQMEEGVVFPPITVFYDGSSYWLASGFHRLFAEKQRGKETLKVTLINGNGHIIIPDKWPYIETLHCSENEEYYIIQ